MDGRVLFELRVCLRFSSYLVLEFIHCVALIRCLTMTRIATLVWILSSIVTLLSVWNAVACDVICCSWISLGSIFVSGSLELTCRG
jgi:hypothetical protein